MLGPDNDTISLRERGKVAVTKKAFLATEAVVTRRRDRREGADDWRVVEVS